MRARAHGISLDHHDVHVSIRLHRLLRDGPVFGTPPENVYVYVDVYVYVMPEKTTILLREDVKSHLLRKVGPRGLSEAINNILANTLFRSKDSLFGADPWLNTKGLRDEREPHEDL